MRDLLIGLVVLTAILGFAIPESTWEFDETLFFRALDDYDPVAHHPPPPGYPVFIGAGKVVRLVMPSAFAALVTLSFMASLAGFVCFALAVQNMTGDSRTGVIAALLFYVSPAMLVHSTLPISDPGALALLAATLLLATRLMNAQERRPPAGWSAGVSPARQEASHQTALWFGVLAALTVGWRPQFSIVVLPLLFATLIFIRDWRARLIAIASFGVVCIAWLLPLIAATGGIREAISFEANQAAYLAAHDADTSRSGWTPAAISLRFIAHPWGTKFLSAPILFLAAVGAGFLVRQRRWMATPFAVAAMTYLAFALSVMDPADGVRYALPGVLFVAFLAAAGVVAGSGKVRVMPYIVAAVFVAASLGYVWPFLVQRRSIAAPPVQAANFARETYPENSVALYELPLWPHATYLLEDFEPMPVEAGLRKFFDDETRPMFLYADGASSLPGARVFRWSLSDAYSKLTRNHYRIASIIPLPPNRRYASISGVYQTEREVEGDEWRWVADRAAIRLPGGAQRVTLIFGLPPRSLPDNRITVSIGSRAETASVSTGEKVTIAIDVPAGERVLSIAAARAFVPDELTRGVNRDRRRLAVMLHDLLVE